MPTVLASIIVKCCIFTTWSIIQLFQHQISLQIFHINPFCFREYGQSVYCFWLSTLEFPIAILDFPISILYFLFAIVRYLLWQHRPMYLECIVMMGAFYSPFTNTTPSWLYFFFKKAKHASAVGRAASCLPAHTATHF